MIRCAAFVFVLIVPILSVDRSNFKTCDQSSFCKYVTIIFVELCSIASSLHFYYSLINFYTKMKKMPSNL